MLEDLDALAARIAELAKLVHGLRTENQQLRAQLATANGEVAELRQRIDEAGRRLDTLLERLPPSAASSATPKAWNT
jgi:phage shock protein A